MREHVRATRSVAYVRDGEGGVHRITAYSDGTRTLAAIARATPQEYAERVGS